MGLFNFQPKTSKKSDKELLKKSSLPVVPKATNLKLKSGNLADTIKNIRLITEKQFKNKKDKLCSITSEQQLIELIDLAIKNKVLSIDTETTSLDPITTTLAGVCLYTPGSVPCYIPINHVNFVTGVRLSGQLTEDFVKQQLERYVDSNPAETIMFNSDFDVRVLHFTLGLDITCTWDCYTAARLLDENNKVNRLKALWDKYVNKTEQTSATFEELFSGVPFTMIPIDIAYLYAANDPLITYELYKFQYPFLTPENSVCQNYDLVNVAWVFRNIEMKILPIVAQMENTGVAVDLEYQKKLSKIYNEKLVDIENQFYRELENWQEQITEYRYSQGSSCKLSTKVNINSPTQIAILLYDVMKLEPVSKKTPRGTGEDILEQLSAQSPICKIILEQRGIKKLISTYIDKFSDVINPVTGRVHCKFNPLGTVTGRFSSNSPNLQNIPSHNKDIRKMFVASAGCYLISSDYSAQEPRLTVHLAKDKVGIKAYQDGKDLYAEIASLAFNKPYEDCLEFRPDGTHNAEGKERRSRAKAIFLGKPKVKRPYIQKCI